MPEDRVHSFRYRGLRVLHEHVRGPLTAIALSIRAGARFDGRHPGIAHMAEHMLFQGTTSLDQLALNRRAAELGGEHNADTGHEDIAMTFEVFNEDLDHALALLADQYYRTRIDSGRFQKERRVVLDEIRGRIDDPVDYVHTQLWNHFFRGPLAHAVWGSIGSLRDMRASDVSGFLRRHFTHRRSALAVVGGASSEAVRRSVRRHFAHGDAQMPAPEPRVRLGRSGLLRLRRGNGNQAYVARMVAVSRVPRQLIATGIALDLVGSDPDSYLFQAIRERHGLGYDVSANLEWGRDWAVAVLAASGARGQGKRLLRVIDETCRRAVENGFDPEDLVRARKKLRYRYASLAQSRIDRALAAAEGALTGFPAPAEAARLVASITQAEIEQAWRQVVGGHSLDAILDA